jgi:hypothetical protein
MRVVGTTPLWGVVRDDYSGGVVPLVWMGVELALALAR